MKQFHSFFKIKIYIFSTFYLKFIYLKLFQK